MKLGAKNRYEHIQDAAKHSEDKLRELRNDLSAFEDSGQTVLVCGSYARREASAHSDIDYFVIPSNPADGNSLIDRVRTSAERLRMRSPAKEGAFGDTLDHDKLLSNIGGLKDSNLDMTQRVLLLLEGDWLVGQHEFGCLKQDILGRYVKEDVPDRHLALFLLNDIIRYWRIICVDYEYKVHEEGKPWAIRNIKLVFSRKLLYASGLFSVALTANLSRDGKIAKLNELFSLPVIHRMIEICGREAMEPVLGSYDGFLGHMADGTWRRRLEALENTQEEGRDDPAFREIKDEGYRFTRELLKLFEATFHSTHPIRSAIIY